MLFLLLPAIAMSLGWGLRGTIGGGQIGAMIPGAIVSLCLCHLLGWKRDVGIAAAFGAVGVGIGGQETYGQTIGFLRDSATVWWGVTGLAIKGAVWGLAGGTFVALGLMQGRYRLREIAVGVAILSLGTALGCKFIDEPKLLYFSNRFDKPREEVWAGLTVGALCLIGYLAALGKERVSLSFSGWGALAGGLGFGGGGAIFAFGTSLAQPYHGWPWWKVMEFTFGFLFGIGLGAAAYRQRDALLSERDAAGTAGPDRMSELTVPGMILVGIALSAGVLWVQFTVPYRAIFTLVGAALAVIARSSNILAWHVALSMTVTGFLRDFLAEAVKREWLAAGFAGWETVFAVALPVAAIVTWGPLRGRISTAGTLLGLTWLATFFGLVKMTAPHGKEAYFVPAVFLVEAVATTVLLRVAGNSRQPGRTGVE